MKLKLSIVIATVALVLFGFSGCGEDYQWDTDNSSPLEGKYETRDISQDLTKERQLAITKSMSQRLLFSNKEISGLSVSILFDDNTSFDVAYGCAELKPEIVESGLLSYETGHTDNCAVPLSTTHRFKIGSLTKSMVARTIFDLDDDINFDFSIEDPITQHLPESILAVGDFSGIKVSHLLKHTSGLPDIDLQPGTPVEIITRAMKKNRYFRYPGQMYLYSNLGYILLGQIIEEVTQDSWQVRVKNTLDISVPNNNFILPEPFDPNWIDTSGGVSWLTGESGTLKDGNSSLVSGYMYEDNTSSYVSMLEMAVDDMASSAGSAIGKPHDIAKWVRSMATNKNNLLSTTYFSEHVSTMNTNNYQDIYFGDPNRNMGSGFLYIQDQNVYLHGGKIHGYNCTMIYSINEKMSISACANTLLNIATDFGVDLLNELYPYRDTYLESSTTTY